MKNSLALALATVFLAPAALARPQQPEGCAQLARTAMPGAKITLAQVVAAGAFTPPTNATAWMERNSKFFKSLPAFCRVTATAAPSADSDIKIEVWLPLSGWNGRFRGQGNGGFAGEIDYLALAAAVAEGYATAMTDTGHAASGVDAGWALGHPEKIVDFGYRAIHEMTRIGKASAAAFYGRKPDHSYFTHCSNGGRQALMEAERFPDDYDGIVSGAPAYFWTHLLASAVRNQQVTTGDPTSYIPSSKLPAIARAVNEACDAADGVKDGVLNDPRKCKFDPQTLVCKTGDTDSCLTGPQAVTLGKLYESARDSKGAEIAGGFLPGAEEGGGGWGLWITGPAPGKSLIFSFGTGFFANMVYNDPAWDYRRARLDQVVKDADQKFAGTVNATSADLRPFQARGGKLILFHGWNDAAITPFYTVHFYERVTETMGPKATGEFVRLYMVPGLQHCGGGPGANDFGQFGPAVEKDSRHNIQLAMEQWVEKGVAPGEIIATKRVDDDPAKSVQMTRPLCPYPQIAKYRGAGDTKDAASFSCALP